MAVARPREEQDLQDARAIGHSKQTSWWRRAMHRVSGRASGDDRYAELGSPTEKQRSPRYGDVDIDMDPLDDPPPPSIIGRGHGHVRQDRSPRRTKYAPVAASDDEDKLEFGGRQRRKREREQRNKERERDSSKPRYIPQRSQPVDFRPTDHHKQAQQAERALAPGTPEYALRAAELSRSPPRAAVPLKPPSIARTDSLLGRMFTRPTDDTALSHSGEGNSTPGLSRNMSMASDPRLLSFKDTRAPNFAALTLQSPIPSLAPDAGPANVDQTALSPSVAPHSHTKEETVPPPAPPKDIPGRSVSPAGSTASFATAADSEVFSLLLRPADEPPPPPLPEKRQSKDQLPSLPDAHPLSPVQMPWESETVARAVLPPVLDHHLARPEVEVRHPPQQGTRPVVPPQSYDSGPPRNLRRPAKIVIPAPLSPARYPDGTNAIPGASYHPAMDPRRDDFAVPPPTSSRDHRRRPDSQQFTSPPRQEQRRHRDPAPQPVGQYGHAQQYGQQYGQVPHFDQQYRQTQRFDQPYQPPRNERPAGHVHARHGGPHQHQDRGREPLSPPSASRFTQHNTSPHERGRRTERRTGPPPGSGSPHHYLPPPVLPGLEYPPSPPRVPQSPPHAAMFPGSNFASPERGGFAASPTEVSPSRVLRLPRDDVPATRPPLVSGRSTLSIATSRDGPGPRHPQVQQYARNSADSVGLPYPADAHTNAQRSQQDRRRSAPVAPQAHPPPGHRYNFSPTRQPEARHVPHSRPPGAAAPRVHSPRGDRGGDYNQFPVPLSPTPLRPSPTNITNITPRTPDPTTGLVPYTLRQDRPPSGMETVRAPWT